MKDKNYILQLIKKSVSSTEPNAILILYGSYARGDYKEDSDLDLLVLIDKDEITRSDQKRIKYPLRPDKNLVDFYPAVALSSPLAVCQT